MKFTLQETMKSEEIDKFDLNRDLREKLFDIWIQQQENYLCRKHREMNNFGKINENTN